jgi:hypothetical protein
VQLVLWFKTAPVVGGAMTPSGIQTRVEAGRQAEARHVELELLRRSRSALPDEPVDQVVHQDYRLYLTDREVNC